MAEIIRMPRLSDTMEEGVIVGWLKKVGDVIEPGDILAEVETDKATMDLESYHEGILLHIGVKEGPVAVNGILAVIGEEGEDYEAQLKEEESKDGSASEDSSDKEIEEEEEQKEAASKSDHDDQPIAPAPSTKSDKRLKASPLAKSIAAEAGIELASLKGSGDQGRIVKKDVTAYLAAGDNGKQSAKTADFQPITGETTEVPVSQMRKVIARRLSESKFGAPHFYVTVEIDMKNAIAARKQINEEAPPKISFNDMIVKAAAAALKKHKEINASWLGDKIRYNGDINIGVAVAVDDGLMVPVVNHADQKSLSQINAEVHDKAGRARDRKLQAEEMSGNTFTISNLGMFQVDEFTAIINPPDACIMAVGSIAEKPVVRDGQIVVGHTMKVTLSADHRVVDGASAAKYLQTFRSYLESPIRMMV